MSLQAGKETARVLMAASVFQTEEGRYKLIAFQNVSHALDETKAKAWQKLLSVMTHEIMNSIAPHFLPCRYAAAAPHLAER